MVLTDDPATSVDQLGFLHPKRLKNRTTNQLLEHPPVVGYGGLVVAMPGATADVSHDQKVTSRPLALQIPGEIVPKGLMFWV